MPPHLAFHLGSRLSGLHSRVFNLLSIWSSSQSPYTRLTQLVDPLISLWTTAKHAHYPNRFSGILKASLKGTYIRSVTRRVGGLISTFRKSENELECEHQLTFPTSNSELSLWQWDSMPFYTGLKQGPYKEVTCKEVEIPSTHKQ